MQELVRKICSVIQVTQYQVEVLNSVAMTSSQTCYIGGHADSDLNTATEESRHMMITTSLEGDWAK